MVTSPDINGLRYDFSSIEIVVNGTTVIEVKSINYSHKLEPGKVRGSRSAIQGRTRGQYDAEGAIELYKAAMDELRASLGEGYMERSFDILCHHADTGQPVTTDRLTGCRIKSEAQESSESGDALVTKCDLDIFRLTMGGIGPITNDTV